MFKFFKASQTVAIAAIVTAGLALSSAANAVTLSFTGATLSDGGTITGTFDYVGGIVSNVDIETDAGTVLTFEQTYTSGTEIDSSSIEFSGTSTAPGSFDVFLFIALDGNTFADLENGTATSATILTGRRGSEEEINSTSGGQFRGVTGGLIVADPTPAPVPLPAGAPLLIAGLGGLALLRKKRAS